MVMDGGGLRRPPLIRYLFCLKNAHEVCTKDLKSFVKTYNLAKIHGDLQKPFKIVLFLEFTWIYPNLSMICLSF